MSDVHPFYRRKKPTGDTAITTTRLRRLTLEGQDDGVWSVLARPSSLHGAHAQMRMNEEKWRAQGFNEFRLRVDGKDLTDAQRALCLPRLLEILT